MEFASCRGDDAVVCNAEGSNYEIHSCEFGCTDAIAGCNQCAPGTSACAGDTLVTCGSDGTTASSETCRLGCIEGPSPHCAHIVPRYLADVCDSAASAASLVISSTATFDTALDTNCNGGIISQAGAPSLCVARYGAFTIPAGVTLTGVGGTDQIIGGGRALAIVTDGDLSIEGSLDISASGSSSGPGGGAVQHGGTIGPSTGQGGAGFKTAGGAGGNLSTIGGSTNGGAASTNPALLTALVGGTRSSGGAGGGVLLISCRGTVSITGLVDAGGGGGFATFTSGGGGGAGGNVVLQGVAVTVTGEVFANGGGGAAGTAAGQSTAGAAGQDGVRADNYSSPGGVAQSGGGNGGDGARHQVAPRGGEPPASGGHPGGGGGSVGFFQSYTPAGVVPVLTPSHASPPFEPNGTIPTR